LRNIYTTGAADPLPELQRAIGFHGIVFALANDTVAYGRVALISVAQWDGVNLYDVGLPTRYQGMPVVVQFYSNLPSPAAMLPPDPRSQADSAERCPRFPPSPNQPSPDLIPPDCVVVPNPSYVQGTGDTKATLSCK
jgi:hypothetical protein